MKQEPINKQIIIAFQNGDKTAFQEIYNHIFPLIYKITYSMTKNKEDAEDLTTDTFIKIYEKRHKYNFQTQISTWAYKIAVNNTLNYLKRKNSILKKIPQLFFHQHIHHHKQEIDTQNTKSKLQEYLDQINPKYKMCLLLSEVQELSYQEISKILKIPLGSVKTSIYRAKQQLKKLYQKEGELKL